jgi:hypothetical protein
MWCISHNSKKKKSEWMTKKNRKEVLCTGQGRKGLENLTNVIKRTVKDFYVDKKTVPTYNKRLSITAEKIHFPSVRGGGSPYEECCTSVDSDGSP